MTFPPNNRTETNPEMTRRLQSKISLRGGRLPDKFGLTLRMSAMTYTSDLSKDECLGRLQAHTGRGLWTRWAEGTISARIHGNRFRLFAAGSANVRNSFAPFFYGHLEDARSNTLTGNGARRRA
jgi:hypothetical protein